VENDDGEYLEEEAQLSVRTQAELERQRGKRKAEGDLGHQLKKIQDVIKRRKTGGRARARTRDREKLRGVAV
jgi:hypothetical protein